MKKIRIDKDKNIIPSEEVDTFVRNGNSVFFKAFQVYKDGVIDCFGESNIEGFVNKIRKGTICLKPEKGDKVRFGRVGNTECDVVVDKVKVYTNDTEDKMILTVLYIIDKLNGIDRCKVCIECFNTWVEDKNEGNLQQLEENYLKLPHHYRHITIGHMMKISECARYITFFSEYFVI